MNETIHHTRLSYEARLAQHYAPQEAHAIVLWVLEECLGLSRSTLLIEGKDRRISQDEASRLEAVFRRIEEGEPMQYALGVADFYHLRLEVGKGVLIPRPETEELVELIIREPRTSSLRYGLDVGTGSGCIPIALCHHLPSLQIQAVDLSAEALAIARRNAQSHALEGRITFVQANALDWSKTFAPAPFDLIVSNPPYIHPAEGAEMMPHVLDYEPHLALFAPEQNPIIHYEALAHTALNWGANGAHIYAELNPRYASETLAQMSHILAPRLACSTLLPDLSGKERFIHLTLA